MSYPQIVDYNDAVQTPSVVFSDPELQGGRVASNAMGLPLALSGGFALTYNVTTGGRQYAVRCFHREVPEIESRYAAISTKLVSIQSPYFVQFDFQPTGILIRGKRYPVVKMDWIAGETLGMHIESHASSELAMQALREKFQALASTLETHGIAHGDLQNENVIVVGEQLRLIDYDGMFVPGFPRGRGTEIGHKHFQHPDRGTQHFGPEMDRFSFIAIDTSLAALREDPSLHRRYREGGATILFKANDFADPASSPVFREICKLKGVADSARRLANLCAGSIDDVPRLSEFLQGKGGNEKLVRSRKGPEKQAYISAFTVVDASDFHAALAQVGNRVELVGQIVSVKSGIGKRGRGRGKPWLFVNFGDWTGESVKLTIWSEGLANMREKPTEAWVGKWISVTGLMEPPYEGAHYGRSYTSVGVTVSDGSQIVQISAADAAYRMGHGSAAARATVNAASVSRNRAILDGLRSNPAGSTSHRRKGRPRSTGKGSSAPKQAAASRNKAILAGLATSTSTTSGQGSAGTQRYASGSYNPGSRAGSGSSGWWWWIIAGLVMLWLFNS